MIADADLPAAFLAACKAGGVMAATAESCTGGLIVAALTDLAGSSAVVDRGFVTYSNDAKIDLLGVPADTIATHGAVSDQTARAMAEGGLARSRAGIALAVTGIAGPGGGAQGKPVGLVWFAVAVRNGATTAEKREFGDIGRRLVREAAVRQALRLGLASLAVQAGGAP